MSVIVVPTSLDRDVDFLIDVFRELHEVECMTGRTGLSARVRLSIMNIVQSADKAACVQVGHISHRKIHE